MLFWTSNIVPDESLDILLLFILYSKLSIFIE